MVDGKNESVGGTKLKFGRVGRIKLLQKQGYKAQKESGAGQPLEMPSRLVVFYSAAYSLYFLEL